MKCIRWGGISSVRQKGYTNNDPTFHSPPARRGIYCFPLGIWEPFLLGSSGPEKNRHDPESVKWWEECKAEHNYERLKIGSKKGESCKYYYTGKQVVDVEELRDDRWRKMKGLPRWNKEDLLIFQTKPTKVSIFDHRGDVWCHLEDIIPHKYHLAYHGSWVLVPHNIAEKYTRFEFNRCQKRTARQPWSFSIDHLEVFIERVVETKNLPV